MKATTNKVHSREGQNPQGGESCSEAGAAFPSSKVAAATQTLLPCALNHCPLHSYPINVVGSVWLPKYAYGTTHTWHKMDLEQDEYRIFHKTQEFASFS